MDCAEFWKLEDGMTPPFMDQGQFLVTDSQYYSLSSDGQFESSFSSSVTSHDECYTPPMSDSSGIDDLDKVSSLRASRVSEGSNCPVDDSIFYYMASTSQVAKSEADNKAHLYVTPCHNNVQDHNMMNYDHSRINDMYVPIELQNQFSHLPEMVFDNVSGLLFHDTTSPVPPTSSPSNFVVPSQTFISEPYRPKTPNNMPRAILGSPLEEFSQSEEMKYFMSPREIYPQTPSSSISSGSNSTLRPPPIKILERSAALHRVQSTGASRISKKSRRSQRVTSKIGRVASGAFRCDYPGCKTIHAFHRHEHLKRHQKTHLEQELIRCEFCDKPFAVDRPDNYKSHVVRHSTNKQGTRTRYFPEALALVNLWKEQRRQRQKARRTGWV